MRQTGWGWARRRDRRAMAVWREVMEEESEAKETGSASRERKSAERSRGVGGEREEEDRRGVEDGWKVSVMTMSSVDLLSSSSSSSSSSVSCSGEMMDGRFMAGGARGRTHSAEPLSIVSAFAHGGRRRSGQQTPLSRRVLWECEEVNARCNENKGGYRR